MDIKPLCGALGSEIRGVDLAKPGSKELDVIRDAFLESHVLVFPDQKLDPAAQIAFTENFGPVEPHPLRTRAHAEGFPAVLILENRPGRPGAPNDYWHSDISHADAPPAASCLHALIIPDGRGDTMYCNMAAAYDGLSGGLKRMIDPLKALHSGMATYERSLQSNDARKIDPAEITPPRAHPIVRTHPDSGKKSLFVNPHFTVGIDGMTGEESQPVLDVLYAAALKPENIYRHRWRPGDLVIWDNRATMHYAVRDYTEDMPRKMRRTTAGGEVPF